MNIDNIAPFIFGVQFLESRYPKFANWKSRKVSQLLDNIATKLKLSLQVKPESAVEPTNHITFADDVQETPPIISRENSTVSLDLKMLDTREVESIIMRGFMFKYSPGSTLLPWKKRYVALSDGGKLYFFKTEVRKQS